jgi:hypothetical protein
MKRAYSNKQIKSTDSASEEKVPVKNKRYFFPEHSVSVDAKSAQDAEKNLSNNEK